MSGLPVVLGARLLGVKSALAKVPPKVWYALAVTVALILGVLWHQHKVHQMLDGAEQAGENKAYANLADKAKKLSDQANALNLQISKLLRSKSDAEATRIVTQYRDVIVRGPGKAACTAVSGLATTSSGSGKTSSQARTAVAPVPSGAGAELIAMPFAGAAAGVRDHDLLLNEAQSWRTWYQTYAVQWAKWNADATKARANPH